MRTAYVPMCVSLQLEKGSSARLLEVAGTGSYNVHVHVYVLYLWQKQGSEFVQLIKC